MKGIKSIVAVLCLSLGLSSCNFTNGAKGGLIGGAAGGAVGSGLGAGIGALIGGKSGAKLGAAIGAGVGVAAGGTAGALIGKKMDRAKAAAAEALKNSNANVTTLLDENGNPIAVKVTLDNGILFNVGKADLQTAAKNALANFASNVLNVYTDCDVAICGYASSDGSDATNLKLSQQRADAVTKYLNNSCNVANSQIKSSIGYGETNLVMVNGKEDMKASRRVEVLLYPSQAMVDAANNGTLQ